MSHSNDLSPEHPKNLNIIIRNGEYLLTLINQILDISKIEAENTTLNENQFNLHQLLNDLKNMFQLTADNKGLELLFHCEEEVPRYVRGNEVKLRQVLINVLSNALKFTLLGSINTYIKKSAINFQYEKILSFIQLSIYNNFQNHDIQSSRFSTVQIHKFQNFY